MYGLIGKMLCASGKRAELASILLENAGSMPGCLSYVIAEDSSDPNALWITEVWNSKEDHAGSLHLPSVQDAIGRGRSMITGFGERFETNPVGGHGLVASQ